MASGLKFRIQKVEGLYYLCSKTKAQISCIVQLICAFVFAYAKSRFSHGAAQVQQGVFISSPKCAALDTKLQTVSCRSVIEMPKDMSDISET